MATKRKTKMLLAGGEQNYLEVIRAAFEDGGFLCDIVNSCEAGFEQVRRIGYKAVIVDGDNWTGPGTRLCDFIRSDSKYEATRLIIITEAFNRVDSFKSLSEELKSDLVVGRPAAPQTIVGYLERISSHLKKKRNADPEEELFFAVLRNEYPPVFFERLQTIDRILASVAGQPGDTALLSDLRFCVHKINGAAGSYGFPQVSVTASEWEHFLDTLIKSNESVSKETEAAFHTYLYEIKINYQFDRLAC
jgi:hypothetical protein